MNVVDSSGWLEYFADGPNADFFAAALEDVEALIVPVITLYEVFKRVQVIELNSALALAAAKISLELKLPMADSLILATAQAYDATLWSQDADFAAIAGMQYKAKNSPEEKT